MYFFTQWVPAFAGMTAQNLPHSAHSVVLAVGTDYKSAPAMRFFGALQHTFNE